MLSHFEEQEIYLQRESFPLQQLTFFQTFYVLKSSFFFPLLFDVEIVESSNRAYDNKSPHIKALFSRIST